ncbi:MAG: ArsR family transcriptional regulator [Deltaproteobacteria bacterium]|nr:ArsR family transcriptional regulator [Deltaproteobacteria bacterium]NIS76222.1 ArsR family transcriptional regulator [Deltaproteobacteria bacterium]
MAEPGRVTPEEARKRVSSGEALLVCAYHEDAKFQRVPLEGAIPFSEFSSKVSSLPKDKELIFYCA